MAAQNFNNYNLSYDQFSCFPLIGTQYGISTKTQPSFQSVSATFSETSTGSALSPTWNTSNDIQVPIEPLIDLGDCILKDDSDSTSISSTFLKGSKKIQKSPVEPRNSQQAARRRPNRKRNDFTPQEDAKLLELMKKYGQCWAMISSELPGRNGKQVRDRYVNNLAPGIKCGNWTPEEDKMLVDLQQQLGNKWSKIASQLPGRTEAQVKNRFYSCIRKKSRSNGNQASLYENASQNLSSSVTSPELEVDNEESIAPEFDFDALSSEPVTITVNESDAKSSTQASTCPVTNVPSLTDEDITSYGNVIRIPYFPGRSEPFQFENPLSLFTQESSDKSYLLQPESSVPSLVDNNNQVDDMLNQANVCLNNDPHNIDIFFAEDLNRGETGFVACSEPELKPSQREMELRMKKAYLEMMLERVMKEMGEL